MPRHEADGQIFQWHSSFHLQITQISQTFFHISSLHFFDIAANILFYIQLQYRVGILFACCIDVGLDKFLLLLR